MGIKLILPGADRGAAIMGAPLPSGDDFCVVAASNNFATRGDAEAGRAVEAGDIIELTWENGLITWELPVGAEYTLPVERQSGDRGLGSALLVAWQALRALVKKDEVNLHKLVKQADDALSSPTPRLLQVGADGTIGAQVTLTARTDATLLVLVHGTFSSISDGFAGLALGEGLDTERKQAWDSVVARYGGRIYGFDHATLSVSPVENARDLLRLLPKGQKVDILSHSRGGLVAELVAGAGLDGAVPGLESLVVERKDRGIVVERHIRVASPVRGTRLASQRSADFIDGLSTIVNLLAALVPNGPMIGGVKAVIYAARVLVSAITNDVALNPAVAPGLHAMMPDGPVVRAVNSAPAPDTHRLIVGGVFTGSDGLGGTLLRVLPNGFFGGDTDLVVDTERMYTTGDFGKARALEPFGPGLNHVTYFTHPATRDAIVRAMGAPDWNTAGLGLEVAERPKSTSIAQRGVESFGGRMPSRRPTGDGRDVVIVLPGLMGSTLASQSGLIWANVPRLVTGAFAHLDLDRDAEFRVNADGIIADYYEQLVATLALTYDVGVFAFDWRRPLADTAGRLAEQLGAVLDGKRRVHLVAHSMGSVVVQMLVAEQPAIWKRIRERSGQVVMMGPPLQGAWDALAAMLGEHPLLRGLAAADLVNESHEVLNIVRTFEGVLALLPSNSAWFLDPTWLPFGGAPRRLAEALGARKRLDRVTTIEGCTLILGTAPVTRSGWKNSSFLLNEAGEGVGDGTVPYTRSVLTGAPTWYVAARHGDIPKHPDTIRMIGEILAGGQPSPGASSAPRSTPASPRDMLPPLAAAPFLGYPTEADLLAAAMGGGGPSAVAIATIRLRIFFGGVDEAPSPVLVENTPGTGLRGALARLGKLPGSPLPRLATANVLPQRLGESYTTRWGGYTLLVIGTGEPFDLTPVRLADAVQVAVRRFCLEQPDAPVTLSATLIGTGNAGVLSIEDSLRGLMEGFTRAMDDLIGLDPSFATKAGELVVVNAFEDLVAILQDRAPAVAQAVGTENVRWELAPTLSLGLKRRGRRLDREDRRANWTTLNVTTREGVLRYTLTGRRTTGRTDEVCVPIQDLEADLATIMKSPQSDRGSAGEQVTRILSRQIFPRDLRDEIYGGAPLRLVLDVPAAGLPWEMATEPERGGRPLAVGTPMLRTLETASVRTPSPLCSRNVAIVLGDGAGGDTGLAYLQGAVAEAAAIDEMLERRGVRVTRVGRAPEADLRRTFLGRIAESSCRILHVAGHGIYNGPGGASGLLLGRTQGQGIEPMYRVITAAELLNAFGSELPELVFFNCCHLGSLDGPDHQPGLGRGRLAASVAQTFIERGVRGVVAAGWAVDDAAAKVFACVFYERMLDGLPFGLAVRAAREAAWNKNPRVNTWGAYQAYGDPAWTMAVTGPATGPTSYPLEAIALDAIDDAVFIEAPLDVFRQIARIVAQSPAANTAEVHLSLALAFDALGEGSAGEQHVHAAEVLRPGLQQFRLRTKMRAGAEAPAAPAPGDGEKSLPFSLNDTPLSVRPRPAEFLDLSGILKRTLDRVSAQRVSAAWLRKQAAPVTGGGEATDATRGSGTLWFDPLRTVRDDGSVLPGVTTRLFIRTGSAPITGLPKGLATAGYGPGSKIGANGDHPLQVRAIALEDHTGARVILVVADIHTGTRLLHHEAVNRLKDLGVTLSTLVLAGTHTHTGPARIYGNSLYDGFTGGFLAPTPRADAWEPVVAAIEKAVRGALGKGRTACTVAPLQGRVSEIATNRSRCAFPYKLDAWTSKGWPGEGLEGADELRAVDGRLRGFVFRDDAGKVCATYALVACHNTSMGNQGVWDPDFVGRAMTQAEAELGGLVAIALSGAGDQSPLPLDGLKRLDRKVHQGEAHAKVRADRLTNLLATAVRAAGPGAPGAIRTRYLAWDPTRSDSADLELAAWRFGAPTLGGAEDGPSPFACAFPEGLKAKKEPHSVEDRLHYPKIKPVGGILDAIFNAKKPAPSHSLHHVEIGDTLLVTLPGEPTVGMAWTLETTLGRAAGRQVLVQGYTGDYCGYFTTLHEYEWQQYEGASTIYGRNTASHLIHVHSELLSADRSGATEPEPDAPRGNAPEAPEATPTPAPPAVEVEAYVVGDQVVVLSTYSPDGADSKVRMQGEKPATVGEASAPWGGSLYVSTWPDPGGTRGGLDVTATKGGKTVTLKVVTIR